MTQYRRLYVANATWFFTVNLATRQNNHLLVEQINALRLAFRYVKDRRPFIINAVVIMPDHLHCIWTLPAGDTDFSTRWNLLKGRFSRSIDKGQRISQSRISKRERGIWQRRFWAHLITDQDDFNNHVDYIHWNPVKHGYVRKVSEWSYSSFHSYVQQGVYSSDWGYAGEFNIQSGE
jgi:putative transposase